jgi:hypothetical protein
MNPTTLILGLIFAAFGAYSSYVMLQVGYFGIWQAGFASPGALQVLLDLCITCLLISSWMIGDARRTGRNPWPYVLLTLAAGSFGPLAYLLVGRLAGVRQPSYA